MNKLLHSASRIYLDTNVLIYFVERTDALQVKIAQLFDSSVMSSIQIFMSEVGVAECLYGAFKRKSAALEAKYNEIFYEIGLFDLLPLDGARAVFAAKIGAEKGLKLVDALHFCAALEANCSIFITNDARFKSSHEVQVLQIADLNFK